MKNAIRSIAAASMLLGTSPALAEPTHANEPINETKTTEVDDYAIRFQRGFEKCFGRKLALLRDTNITEEAYTQMCKNMAELTTPKTEPATPAPAQETTPVSTPEKQEE